MRKQLKNEKKKEKSDCPSKIQIQIQVRLNNHNKVKTKKIDIKYKHLKTDKSKMRAVKKILQYLLHLKVNKYRQILNLIKRV